MTRSLILRLLLLLLSALASAAFAADRVYSFESFEPRAKATETLRLAPGAGMAVRIDLGEVDAGRIAAAKEANANQFLKSLQIGVDRPVAGTAQARATALRWQRVEGGAAAHWEVVSKDARALRVGLAGSGLPAGVQVRFAAAAEPGVVYGPFDAAEIEANGGRFWSPMLEGERASSRSSSRMARAGTCRSRYSASTTCSRAPRMPTWKRWRRLPAHARWTSSAAVPPTPLLPAPAGRWRA